MTETRAPYAVGSAPASGEPSPAHRAIRDAAVKFCKDQYDPYNALNFSAIRVDVTNFDLWTGEIFAAVEVVAEGDNVPYLVFVSARLGSVTDVEASE